MYVYMCIHWYMYIHKHAHKHSFSLSFSVSLSHTHTHTCTTSLCPLTLMCYFYRWAKVCKISVNTSDKKKETESTFGGVYNACQAITERPNQLGEGIEQGWCHRMVGPSLTVDPWSIRPTLIGPPSVHPS